MSRGDIVKYKSCFCPAGLESRTHIVRRTEPSNGWVFVYGMDVPIQELLLEVVSSASG